MNDVKLTDFTTDQLVFLSALVNKQLEETLESVLFLEKNLPESDLLPYYRKRFDQTQLWATQLQNAAVTVKMREIANSN